MGEPAVPILDEAQVALDERINNLLAAHNGDARAALETLLLAVDIRASRISYGFVRGTLPDQQ
jgi:replication-associated recombination protein RarA